MIEMKLEEHIIDAPILPSSNKDIFFQSPTQGKIEESCHLTSIESTPNDCTRDQNHNKMI